MYITKMQISIHHNVAAKTSDSVPVQENYVRSLLIEDQKGLSQTLKQDAKIPQT
jgi:hypothetical protein